MIETAVFGKLLGGEEVISYRLSAPDGAYVNILNLGGIVQALYVPDRNGKLTDVVCGFDTVEDYLAAGDYHGSLVGRCANRIGKGRFALDGKEYTLACNEKGLNHLHGGTAGFNVKLWTAEMRFDDSLVLTYTSPDGEEGYPACLKVRVVYTFTPSHVLRIRYHAESDGATLCNLTNHAYFNLAGYGSCDLADSHRIQIFADSYTAVDEELMPTANEKVEGTMYDLRSPVPMTAAIDHNFMLRGLDFRRAARVWEDQSGRTMEVWTDLPAIQLYTGNMMQGSIPFKGGVPQRIHHAFCLETQVPPDAINHPQFPSCVLRKGGSYDTVTEYRFGIE
ncbi:MAG: galactose mutarotase [Clostridia bacterium]|nr:galactose mutarotase [Clostridia bacterium]